MSRNAELVCHCLYLGVFRCLAGSNILTAYLYRLSAYTSPSDVSFALTGTCKRLARAQAVHDILLFRSLDSAMSLITSFLVEDLLQNFPDSSFEICLIHHGCRNYYHWRCRFI